MKNYKHVGYWWNDSDIEIIEINGKIYALNGWNGEEFTSCWECTEDNTEPSEESYTLKPVYRYEIELIQLDELEENSPKWDAATEVVDYKIY